MITIGSVSVDLEGIITALAALVSAIAVFAANYRGKRQRELPSSSTDNQQDESP